MLGRFGKTPDLDLDNDGIRPKGFDDYDVLVGDVLRGERATMGKSLSDVEKSLRIKAQYLAAIEDGNLAVFDAPSFVSGYVRSYARYLGLDPDAIFTQFCSETGFVPAHGMAAAASKSGQSAQSQMGLGGLTSKYMDAQPQSFFGRIEPGALGSLAVFVLVLGGLAYGGYSVLQEVQKVSIAPVDQAPVVSVQVPAGLGTPGRVIDPVANAAPSLPGAIAARDDAAAARPAQPQTLSMPVMVARDGPISAIDPRKAGVLAEAVAAAESVVVVTEPPKNVEILAARPSWISVTAADGTVLFEKILDAGERYVVPALEIAPRLRAGNSSAVYFVMGGQTYGPASTGPNVVRDVDLSAEGVEGRFTLADLSKDKDLTSFVAEMTPAQGAAPQP